jgi:hypothetical protein
MDSDSTSANRDNSGFWMFLAGAGCAAFTVLGWYLSRDKELVRDIFTGTFSVVTSPFFLETTVFFIGLSLVVLWNSWRLRREGDGWVYLAEDEPRPGQAPDRHDALFSAPPEPEPPQLDLELIEGLLDLGSWSEAGEHLMRLPESVWDSPRVLHCRLRLAEGLGHTEQAAELRVRLTPGNHGAGSISFPDV